MRVSAMAMLIAWAGVACPADVVVDGSKVVGTIRALHGVNGGPVLDQGLVDLSVAYRGMRVPWVRLHDCNWPNPDVVDMHAVFPDWRADASKDASYDFVRTDAYLKSVAGVGARMVYRLGESIEHGADKRRVGPPADVEKWAAVCLKIVERYRERGVGYWEVWNEPDNRPACWAGSDEEFFALYAAAARAIKAKYPESKVGGPGVGDAKGEFVRKFLGFCARERVPLDFFSWHVYAGDVGEVVSQARLVRGMLDEFGFQRAENHLNEWNFLPDGDWGPVMVKGQGAARRRFYERIGGEEGAEFAARVLIALQDERVDLAAYFCGTTQGFGLFDPYGSPLKNYEVFRMFGEVAGLERVEASAGALAGRGKEGLRVMVVGGGGVTVKGVTGRYEVVRFGEVVGGGRVEEGARIELVGEGVWLVRVTGAGE